MWNLKLDPRYLIIEPEAIWILENDNWESGTGTEILVLKTGTLHLKSGMDSEVWNQEFGTLNLRFRNVEFLVWKLRFGILELKPETGFFQFGLVNVVWQE